MEWNKGAMAACETERKFGLAVVLTAEGLLTRLARSRRASHFLKGASGKVEHSLRTENA